ncbi:MAG TPA: hypothetical protein VI277_04150 [Candidatus Limnocylindria bacterium]
MQDDQDTRAGDVPQPDPAPVAEPPPPPPVATSAPPPPVATSAPPAPAPAAQTGQRPTGVTILAVLAAIGGVFSVLGGLALLMSGGFIGVATGSGALGGLAALIGAGLLVSGALSLVFAWGAWGLQPWAWTLGVIIQAISIVLGVFQLINGNSGALLSVAIAALITYYLFRPEIRAAFGRA